MRFEEKEMRQWLETSSHDTDTTHYYSPPARTLPITVRCLTAEEMEEMEEEMKMKEKKIHKNQKK